jgi:hypothetical protein
VRCLLLFAVGVFALGLVAKADAQVCQGKLPFGPGRRLNVDVGVATLNGPTLTSGRSGFLSVDFGGHDYFASATVRRNRYSDYGYTTTEVDLAFGQPIEVLPRSKLTLCPEAELWVEHAANLGQGTNVASLTRSGVASLRAGSLHPYRGVPVAGFVGAGFFLSRETERLTGPHLGPAAETSDAWGGFAEVGAGLQAFRVVDVVIAYRIPVGLAFGLKSTTLLVGVSF